MVIKSALPPLPFDTLVTGMASPSEEEKLVYAQVLHTVHTVAQYKLDIVQCMPVKNV